MDLYTLIDEIKKTWITNEYYSLIILLDKCVDGGSTYGEILGRVGTFLNNIKQENASAYIDANNAIDKVLILWSEWGKN